MTKVEGLLMGEGTYFGKPITLICDQNCDKVWGINNRPKVYLRGEETDEEVDDHYSLADGELGIAPVNPGTYEGDHAKPVNGVDLHNKWCARECERSVIVDRGSCVFFDLLDFSRRFYNKAPHYRVDADG